jgi:hypothetical protein
VDSSNIEKLKNYCVFNNFNAIIDTVADIADSCFQLELQIKAFQNHLASTYLLKPAILKYLPDVVICLSGLGLIATGCTVPGLQSLIFSGAFMSLGSIFRLCKDYKQARAMDDVTAKLHQKLESARNHLMELKRAAGTNSEKGSDVLFALGFSDETSSPADIDLIKENLRDMCSSFEELGKALDRAVGDKPVDSSSTIAAAVQSAGAVTAVVVVAQQVDQLEEVGEVITQAATGCILM